MDLLLQNNPLILLFLVAAVGYFIGNISIKGNSLGVAAVLFIGLAFGAYNPNFNVPDIVFQLGLVLFVYSIGLSSGPAFFKSFKQNGVRDISFVLLMLSLSAIVALIVFYFFSFDAATTAGLYAGSTTNTPALAGVIDLINQSSNYSNDHIQKLVVGYTYSYPMGVLGVMISIVVMEKILRINYSDENKALKKQYNIEESLSSATILVTNNEATNNQIRDLKAKYKWNVVFGRMKTAGGDMMLTNWDTKLNIGDAILVVGNEEAIIEVTHYLGEVAEEKISNDRREYDSRRIFVSNQYLIGKRLSELNLAEKYNATITRVRRGDVDMLANSRIILEQGDRVRFVARRKELKALSKYFGDSYYESSKVNIFSFGFGIALGLLLGTVPFTLPGGITLKLGYAGGPLLVALILGSLHRTGNLVWTLPYGANVTLRQIGLTLLLAVIGLRSGNTFIESLSSGGGFIIFMGGVIISTVTACMSLFIGYKLFKLPFSLLLGFISNQPAILDFANNRCNNRIPFIGYTLMFPIALVMKIVYAQLLFIFLQ